MRLLVVGDLAPTGFGTVTSDLGIQLLNRGMDVRFISQNELGELAEPFKSRTFVVNDQREGWIGAANRGELTMTDLINGKAWKDDWSAQACLIIADYSAARGIVYLTDDSPDAFASIPTYHYCPIEGVGLPPSWVGLWKIIHPIAMSAFGADQIEGLTGTRPPMVYHGIDQSVFFPVSEEHPITLGSAVLRSKEDCKAYFKISPNYRMLFRADTNVMRKRYASLLRSLAPMLAERNDAFLMWHCRSGDEGTDLRDERSKYHPNAQARMVSTGYHDRKGAGQLSRETLNALYNAADIYVSTGAEGFGLTIAEAIACGVPAVGLDYSSVPEVIGPAGFTAPISHLIDNQYAHQWAAVDETKFRIAVERLLDNPKERLRLGAKGPGHVAANFSWVYAAELMEGIFAERGAEVAA